MSEVEVAVVTAVWLALIVLTGLVLVAYRQLDRVVGAGATGPAPSTPGSAVPPLVVQEDRSAHDLTLDGDLRLITFISPTCTGCLSLITELAEKPLRAPTVVCSTTDQLTPELADKLRVGEFEAHTLWDVTETSRLWQISDVPLTYAVADGAIVGSVISAQARDLRVLAARASRTGPSPASADSN